MAKKSSIEKNNRRKRMIKNAAPKRARLKAIIADKTQADGRALRGALKLAELPRNSSATRDPQPLRDDGPSARRSIASSSCAASRCVNSAPRA